VTSCKLARSSTLQFPNSHILNYSIKITDMNQFLNDLKSLVKTHWKTILIIVLVIYLFSSYTDIKSGIMDAWNGK
jgi:hypothetical protein